MSKNLEGAFLFCKAARISCLEMCRSMQNQILPIWFSSAMAGGGAENKAVVCYRVGQQ